MSDFYIVGDIDRPEPRHVTILRDGKLNYIHPDLIGWVDMHMRDGKLNYIHPDLIGWVDVYMRDESTLMQDFGFTVTEVGGFVTFVQNNKCVAKYRDGTSRKWQGCTNFTIDLNSFGDNNAK